MKTIVRAILVAALACGSGCARPDWIEQTLVTVDVTGTWRNAQGGSIEFALEQQGPTAKGYFRPLGPGLAVFPWFEGPIDGTVAGDVFRFRLTNGTAVGEMTVSGDEMKGHVSMGSPLPISLRRVDSPARPRPQQP